MELDVRGDICPYPMLKTVEALKKLPKNKTLVVITDRAPALESIPTQAHRRGFGVTIEQVGNPEWRITLSPEGEA